MKIDPASLPDHCGVYLFRSKTGKVLYVGKAIDIKARVRSHLQDKKNEKEVKLRNESDHIDWIATGTELEALILEDTLIKRYKPRFNIRLKDDKSYPYLLITNERFPSIFQIRGLTQGKGEFFGPHSDPRAVRRSLRWLRKVFPVRSCRRDLSKPSRPCLEHHLGRCVAPCKGDFSLDEYQLMVEGLRRFLSGKREELMDDLKKDMWSASSNEKFEKAALVRDIITGLERIREAQKVVLLNGRDLDAIHISDDGAETSIVKVREGRVIDVVSFSLEGEETLSDPTLDIISSIYAVSGFIPSTITTAHRDMDKIRKQELERFLSGKKGRKVRIIWARGEEKGSLIKMAERNTRLFHMEKERSAMGDEGVQNLQDRLELTSSPKTIEGFDISHLSGTGTVASMVHFKNGKPMKSSYRHYRIRTAENDDYRSMKEVVSRRYKRLLDQDGDFPDLVLIDGGKGQLNAALDAFKEIGMTDIPEIVSIAKKEEEIFRPGRELPLKLKRNDPALKLIQRIRDEAHRFAISYQRKLREKDLTILNKIEGIGAKRAKKILITYDSLEDILKAGPDGIQENCSIPADVANNVVDFIKSLLADRDIQK